MPAVDIVHFQTVRIDNGKKQGGGKVVVELLSAASEGAEKFIDPIDIV